MANIPNFANPNYADDDVNMVMGIYNAIEDTLEMARRESETAHQERKAARRKCIKIIVFILLILTLLIPLVTYVSILAYHHMQHPRVSISTPFLASPPACNGDTRTFNGTGLAKESYPELLHFNYVAKVYWTDPANYLERGDAIISVNGEDVRGNHSDAVWRLIEADWASDTELVVQNCTGALDKLEKCESKYREQYQSEHYPYRYVDSLRRCEKEGFDLNVTSSWADDIWRGAMYFIHEHQGWFPTMHKKTYMS
ncbi:hypothetical protein PRIPAC_90287 [Pristionchus pacificus]|uniref:Uncharacterized protein n=1 Tax=Pristionchus pacificus TaxID=54126 RepID=A0A454XI58_PRIPA|nr:hypothetical protein PRIPAC_90287 [Pristionchus pacificus]|eukprot:PDM62187.1 hypothetical protein PRIPAC_51629 [Pristionchus pacificus]